MFFPNRIANTIDRLLKTNQEFNKYSTAYNKKDEIELSSNSLLSIAMSKHRNKTKDNKLNQNNKTTCIFKHNRVLRNPQRKRNITDITNSFTIHEPQLKFVRRYSKDIDNLLNSKKEMSKTMTIENNTLSNVDLYRNCMKIITNKKKIQSIADEIVYYVKQDNKNKKKNEIKIPTSYNNYFDIVINNVMKKVTFYTSTNEEITTEKVMNLLLSEADILKEDTDNYMKKYCQIKNFSTFIELNDKEKQFLPLINSTRPFTKAEISNKEKQKQDNKLHSQFKGVFNDFQLNAKLNRIDENVARTKRKKHKVKKIGANGEIYYEEVSYTDTNEESQKGEDGGNDIIGGLGQGSIWDTYNKVQNKKTKPKENNNKEEIEGIKQKDDDKNQYDKKGNNATNLTPNKNLVLNQKNLTNSSKRIKLIKNINEDIIDQINSNDNDKQNNNENSQINNNISNDPEETQLMQYYPKSKKRGKHTDNKINLVTLSTHEDSYINSFSKRKKKDDTNSNILTETKDDLMSLFGKNNNKKIEAQKNSEKRKKIKEKIILKDKQYKSSIEEYNENNNNSKDNVNNNENTNNGNSINEVNNRNSNNNHNHRVMNNQKIINLKKKELHDKIKSPKKKKNKKGNHKDNKEIQNDKTNNTFPLNNNENQTLNEEEKVNDNKFANSEMINNINGELFNSDSESKTEESLIIINNGDNIEDVNNNSNGNNNSINGKTKKRKKHKKKNKGENNTNNQSNQSHIENKDNSMSNSNNIDKDGINQENKTNNQNNQINKQNQQGNNKSKFVRKKEEESTNELPQKVENVFFDDPSESGTPFNNSKQNHSLLKINFNGPKKILKKFSSSKMNNYYKPKYPDENEKLIAENEKKLTEEKKNQILSRLNNAIQRDFSQLSNETKIKDINIIEKIKYEMLNETSEEGRERYLEMINQINLLKQSDVSAYISELEREYEPFQEEIESIVKSRKIEERLNRFLQFFGDYRKKQINKRIILSDKIKVVDSKFITTMSDKLYSL